MANQSNKNNQNNTIAPESLKNGNPDWSESQKVQNNVETNENVTSNTFGNNANK
jgi:hypothetical protein